jgi:poly-gamma-glutamate system protein
MKLIGIHGLAAAGLAVLLLSGLLLGPEAALHRQAEDAASRMAHGLAAIRACAAAAGHAADPADDPNGTGLIGLEYSELTTTKGDPAAKRTSVVPDFAALFVHLYSQAGARPGEAVAVGASSSFPAFILAALSAAETLELRPLLIVSLAASQWGANNPRFTWLDMQDCLNRAGVLTIRPLAVSLGGEDDAGGGLSENMRAFLASEAEKRGFPRLDETDLERNVSRRMDLYRTAAGDTRIAAFVNIGGGAANMGEDAGILSLRPGLTSPPPPASAASRGAVHAMADAGVPIIHILNIRGLAERYGFPWDPVPLPDPGTVTVRGIPARSPAAFLILAAAYFLLAGVVLFRMRRKIEGHS